MSTCMSIRRFKRLFLWNYSYCQKCEGYIYQINILHWYLLKMEISEQFFQNYDTNSYFFTGSTLIIAGVMLEKVKNIYSFLCWPFQVDSKKFSVKIINIFIYVCNKILNYAIGSFYSNETFQNHSKYCYTHVWYFIFKQR